VRSCFNNLHVRDSPKVPTCGLESVYQIWKACGVLQHLKGPDRRNGVFYFLIRQYQFFFIWISLRFPHLNGAYKLLSTLQLSPDGRRLRLCHSLRIVSYIASSLLPVTGLVVSMMPFILLPLLSVLAFLAPALATYGVPGCSA
jgi:hypothetical protein